MSGPTEIRELQSQIDHQIDYDWDKLAFLIKKTHELQPLLATDLKRFSEFLGQLAS